MAKYTKLSFVNNEFLGTKLLHANVQCVYIVVAKYQIVSSKAVVRVDWPMYALFQHKHNPYLKASREKMAKFTKAVILSIMIFFGTKLLHANVHCVYIE